jgi:hypothetical protein
MAIVSQKTGEHIHFSPKSGQNHRFSPKMVKIAIFSQNTGQNRRRRYGVQESVLC